MPIRTLYFSFILLFFTASCTNYSRKIKKNEKELTAFTDTLFKAFKGVDVFIPTHKQELPDNIPNKNLINQFDIDLIVINYKNAKTLFSKRDSTIIFLKSGMPFIGKDYLIFFNKGETENVNIQTKSYLSTDTISENIILVTQKKSIF